MTPRRTLPTIRQHWPFWQRLVFQLARVVALAWLYSELYCVVTEERGYRVMARIKGYRLGTNYLHNRRAERRDLRERIAHWNR